MDVRSHSPYVSTVATVTLSVAVVACDAGEDPLFGAEDAADAKTSDAASDIATDIGTDADGTTGLDTGDGDSSDPRFQAGDYTVGDCSIPDTCPTPDNDERYDITCVNRDSAPVGKNFEIHLYGTRITDARPQSSSVKVVWSEDLNSRGSNPTNGPAVSDCHVKAEIYVPSSDFSAGDTIQVGIVRAGTGGDYVDISLE